MKWRIYLGIGLSVWETVKICGKWRRSVGNASNMWWNDNYLTNGLKMWKDDLEIWELANIFGKSIRYMGHFLSIWETA